MSRPIWPVVTENLALQLSATQGGIVHAAQLMPYVPLSIELIEQTLDALAESERVQKQTINHFSAYLFQESFNQPQHTFAPRFCVYSNEPLDDHKYSAISEDVRKTIETELATLANSDTWPAEAVWEHEIIYLMANLPEPISTSLLAGRSRLSFKRIEKRLMKLRNKGILLFDPEINTWSLPPLRYPRPVYARNDNFIRQFPGAVKEELEVRIVKGLSLSLGVLLLSFILAFIGRLPFPIIFFGGIACAFAVFLKVLKSRPKPIPEL